MVILTWCLSWQPTTCTRLLITVGYRFRQGWTLVELLAQSPVHMRRPERWCGLQTCLQEQEIQWLLEGVHKGNRAIQVLLKFCVLELSTTWG